MSEKTTTIPKEILDLLKGLGKVKTVQDKFVGQSESVQYVDTENKVIILVDKAKGLKKNILSDSKKTILVGKCFGNDGLIETKPRRAFQLTYYEKPE